MSNPAPAPAANDAQSRINEIEVNTRREALETAQIEREKAVKAAEDLEKRVQEHDLATRTAEAEHETATTAVASLPATGFTTAEDFDERRSRLANEAIARELARYSTPVTETTEMTDADRTALHERFSIGRLMSDAELAKVRAKRGDTPLAPETPAELAAREDRRRKREELGRTEAALRDTKRRRTELQPEIERVGATRRRVDQDVEMGRRGVATAEDKARDDKRKDEIRQWKSSSALDSAARSLPSAIESTPELTKIAKERRSLWTKATTTVGGGSITATNSDFGKWLKDQGTKNVLVKAKSAYEGVIGSIQPRSERGKALKATAASRIADIEDQIKKIEAGTTQPSRLTRTGRSRSPASRRLRRSRSRSPQVATTGVSTTGKKHPLGGSLGKSRRKRKIVKVNKEPPSVSRYFI